MAAGFAATARRAQRFQPSERQMIVTTQPSDAANAIDQHEGRGQNGQCDERDVLLELQTLEALLIREICVVTRARRVRYWRG